MHHSLDGLSRLRTRPARLHRSDIIGRLALNCFARRFRAHYGLSASAYRARFAKNTWRLPTA